MIRDELEPRLRALGFTGSQGTYDLAVPGHFARLGIYEYWGNTSFRFQFTVDVLTVSHTDWQTFRATRLAAGGDDWGEQPQIGVHYGPGGPWSERLATLMGNPDPWWFISPRRPTLPVAEAIATGIEHHALPRIREHTNPPPDS